MKQPIYADVLVVINLLVDYFLLYGAAVICGRERCRVRMCLGALAGAASSLVIFLPPMPAAVNVALSALVSVIMAAAAFRWCGWRVLLRTVVVLYALSTAYSGGMLLLWQLTGGSSIAVNNGKVYINIDPTAIVAVTVVLYALLSLLSGRIRSMSPRRQRCTLTVQNGRKSVSIEGLVDTGNTLTEPFSGLPVIIVSRKAAGAILPEGLHRSDAASAAAGKVRVIPYHTASGSGLMQGFRPDSIRVALPEASGQISAYLAVAENDSGMTCGAIVNPDVLLSLAPEGRG